MFPKPVPMPTELPYRPDPMGAPKPPPPPELPYRPDPMSIPSPSDWPRRGR